MNLLKKTVIILVIILLIIGTISSVYLFQNYIHTRPFCEYERGFTFSINGTDTKVEFIDLPVPLKDNQKDTDLIIDNGPKYGNIPIIDGPVLRIGPREIAPHPQTGDEEGSLKGYYFTNYIEYNTVCSIPKLSLSRTATNGTVPIAYNGTPGNHLNLSIKYWVDAKPERTEGKSGGRTDISVEGIIDANNITMLKVTIMNLRK